MRNARAKRNLQHNQKQQIPSSQYQEQGLITKQSKLKHWRYGHRTSDYNGCGWIAMVNAMQLLDNPVEPAQVIAWLEQQPFLLGAAAGGHLGTYPWGMKKYFKEQGYSARFGFLPSTQRRIAAEADASIAFYLRFRGGHFVAFERTKQSTDGTPLYHFYNDIYGKQDDLRTLKELWQDNKALLHLVIGIKKNPPIAAGRKEPYDS